jgi:predicted ATPase/class 3 adenylate cyclase
MADLPHGTVTFAFTDIEGSTKLAERFGPAYAELLETHQRLIRDAFRSGVEISTAGDSFFVVFDDAAEAVRAAVAAQRAMHEHAWPAAGAIRVRIGLHTGRASIGGADYAGIEVHRASRIAAAGHGGQVLLSESTHVLVSRELGDEVSVRDLGMHRLKDLAAPERIFQLVIPGLPSDFAPLKAVGAGRTNLPGAPTSFIGRERELAELAVRAGEERLVTVIGAGGTGKTRLALRVAEDLGGDHPDGVWLVELAPVTSPGLVAQEIARTVGVQDEPGRPIAETLADFVRLKRMLVVLDNCEHVIGAVADLVSSLFRSAPGLRILATSREALGLAGEAVYPLPSMGIPPRVDPDEAAHAGAGRVAEIAESEAVRLFSARAAAVAPSFAVTPSNAEAVAEICRRLDGIPLAIELAAARIRILAPEQIAARLEDRFRLLTGGSRSALPRQQTLQALIDWSWDLLDDPDRQLLRRLSVFIGGFTLEAATAVTGGAEYAVIDGIGRLVDRSLVVAQQSTPARYRLLETIRQYGRDRLVEADEMAAMREAHLRHYLALAEAADPELRGPDMGAWLAVLDEDAENLRSAIDWALETDPTRGLRLCVAMSSYWRSRSMLEGFERFRGIIDLADPSTRDGAVLAARVLSAAANLAWLSGNAVTGLPWAVRAVELADEADDPTARYEAMDTLAMTSIFAGDTDDVEELSARALSLAVEAGDWYLVAFTEGGLAQLDAESGNLEAAEARLHGAVEAAARSGNPAVQAFTALSQARVAGFSGRLEEARAAFEDAIAGYAAFGDARLELVARSDYAHALRLGGETAEAEATYRETLHAWLHTGNRGAIANQLESFGYIALSRDDPVRAARLLGAADAMRATAAAPMMPYERTEYEASVERVRQALGDEGAAEMARGAGWSIEEAVAYALDQAGT